MVFASICRHTGSAFIFASKSSDQIYPKRSGHFVNFSLAEMFLVEGNAVLCAKSGSHH